MRVKFTLIALVSTESSVYSGSHQSGFQMRSAPHKSGSSVQRGGRVDASVPKQSPTLARCGGTVPDTHWSKWEVIFCLQGDLSHVVVKRGLRPAPWDAQCALGPWQSSPAVNEGRRWGCQLGSTEHPLRPTTCRPHGDREAGREMGRVKAKC